MISQTRSLGGGLPAFEQRIVVDDLCLGFLQLLCGGSGSDDLGDGDVVDLLDLDKVVPCHSVMASHPSRQAAPQPDEASYFFTTL